MMHVQLDEFGIYYLVDGFGLVCVLGLWGMNDAGLYENGRLFGCFYSQTWRGTLSVEMDQVLSLVLLAREPYKNVQSRIGDWSGNGQQSGESGDGY
jgi:hypothetical protein